jgi:hypothetical protein
MIKTLPSPEKPILHRCGRLRLSYDPKADIGGIEGETSLTYYLRDTSKLKSQATKKPAEADRSFLNAASAGRSVSAFFTVVRLLDS